MKIKKKNEKPLSISCLTLYLKILLNMVNVNIVKISYNLDKKKKFFSKYSEAKKKTHKDISMKFGCFGYKAMSKMTQQILLFINLQYLNFG